MRNFFTGSSLIKFSWIIIVFSVVLGGILRFGVLLNYTGFQGDQSYHGSFIMDIWQGKLPTLGSTTSAGGHSLTPLHYYLFWIFTILGPNPVFQALPNALFSFLSIPALIYFIYRLLNKTKRSLRMFLSAIGGIWWTLFYNDVLFASFEWNPNSIVYFGLSFILLIDLIVTKYIQNTRIITITWVLLGINTAIFTSLHTTTLLLYPIIFSLFIIYNILTTKKLLLPLISLGSFVLVLAPYWIGEILTKGSNTKHLIGTLFRSQSGLTILDKINRIFLNYLEIGPLMYFDIAVSNISFIFLGLILTLSIFSFRGNNKMWTWFLLTIALYFLISMNYAGIYFVHYKEVFWILPIIFTLVSINHFMTLDSKYIKYVSITLIGLLITLSIFINSRFIYRTFKQKSGKERQIGVNDYIEVFSKLNQKSKICVPYIHSGYDREALAFIDKYNTKKDIGIFKDCVTNMYEILPKYQFPDLSQRQIPIKNSPIFDTQVIYQNEAYFLILR